jgi:ribosomal-protein-alanine N-acetyltransferase
MAEIREMTLDDLEEVMEIERESFSVPWTETGFFTFLLRQDTLFLVAEEGGRIAGYCGAVLVPDEGDVTNVAVAGKCRGRGIGKQLVRELAERSAAQGVRKLYLEVRASNTRALELYRGQGFVQTGIRKSYYEDPVEDAVLMCRECGDILPA